MRFGMSGCFLPDDMRAFTPAMCRRVRALGFSGVFTRFRANDPHTTPRADAQALRELLAGEGVRLYQATGYWQNMITPDETCRAEAMRTIPAALRLAGWMGARGIDTGPGSMNPDGPWYPHSDNYTAGARRQLVRTLQECAKAAEDAQVFLSLESHQLVTLKTPEITREVLDEVGSPWVTADYDSANWITLDTIFDTGAALDHHFDVLGPRVISCHAKDIWIENRLTLHLQDGCPGKGRMNFHTLFRRMQALSPELPVISEGNNTAELPAVSALFHRVAAELDIAVLDD
jgi:sugar phosphate isomerase/epimerase